MNVRHPDGKRTIVMVDKLGMVGEIEDNATDSNLDGWISIGHIGSSGQVLVDHDEWDAFVNLVGEIDVIIKEKKNGNEKNI